MHENEQRPLPHFSDDEVRTAFHRTFAGTRGHQDGRAVRMNPLPGAFEQARNALPYVDSSFGPGANDFRRSPKPAATRVQIDLGEFISNTIQGDNVYTTNMQQAGESLVIDPRAVIESRCVAAQSGARIALAHPRDNALAVASGDKLSGLAGLYRDPALARRTVPATFADVAGGATAAAQSLPFKDATWEWPDAPSAAFSTTVTRAMDRAVGGGDVLWESMLDAILGGLAEYADRVFFAAVNTAMGATPPAFTFGLAAAQHLQESDLRAVIGTSGTGAGYRGDGAFVATPGVPAAMSKQLANTIIGAFGTGVIALWPTIDVQISRLNAQGDATVTVFASAQGIVPDGNVFWTASA